MFANRKPHASPSSATSAFSLLLTPSTQPQLRRRLEGELGGPMLLRRGVPARTAHLPLRRSAAASPRASRAAAAEAEASRAGAAPPRVVCLGWFGARERHVAKYAELWRQAPLGARAVVQHVPDPKAILAPALWMARDLERFAAKAEAALGPGSAGAGEGEGPVIVHAFSMAGFLFYGTLLAEQAARRSGSPASRRWVPEARQPRSRPGLTTAPCFDSPVKFELPRPAAVVLDSAPCELDAAIAVEGVLAGLFGPGAARSSPAGSVLRPLARPVAARYLRSGGIVGRLEAVQEAWAAVRCPLLAVYR